MKPLNVRIYFYTDGRINPYTAYAIDGKTPYDWKVGNSESESLARMRAIYISWRDRPIAITRSLRSI